MSMRWDGSIQSHNTPAFDKPGILRNDYAFYRAMVTKVLYADDPNNISKNAQNPEVMYEVILLGGVNTGQRISNVRLAEYLGGNDNYSERTLKASSKDPAKAKLSDHDGDVVYVEFVQGHSGVPVIVAMGKGISNKVAATSSTGPRLIESYNGFITKIDKTGTHSLTHKDGTSVTTTTNKVTIKTAGGATVTIDGASNNISIKAGSTEALIDGSSGKISLKGDFVDLGSSVSDFVTKFTELATAFNSHIHLVPQAPAGTLPSQPPIAPLVTSVGSQTVKVQS